MDSGGFFLPVRDQNAGHVVLTSQQKRNATLTSDCIQTYKSVPPRPICYTLVDMLENSAHGKRRVSSNAPKDFEKRFRSKPTTKPKIVDFTNEDILPSLGKCTTNGFYPPEKLRITRYRRSPTDHQTPLTDQLQMTDPQRSSNTGSTIRSTPESDITAKSIAYLSTASEEGNCDDLSYLNPPYRLSPRREVPWVFRFKVKKGMNELSKIMASKSRYHEVSPSVL